MSDGPLNVSMKDTDKIIGKFAVLYRNEVKTLAKIESFVKVDEKERRMIYEVHAGPDKGKRYSSKYDESQMTLVYDDNNKILAGLET